MHPVNYLFDEIYRNWGIPQAKRETHRQGRAQTTRRVG